MLRVGTKRRRTRAEIDEFNALKEQELAEHNAKDDRIRELERQLLQSKHKIESGAHAQKAINEMLDAKYLVQNADGTYGPVESQSLL